ncbi:MAG: hypothetical protein EPN92_12090 [Chitinophagaceae bacterium]|nr:MAG: hypothetical protein EPN92_12090 [Chitinophagaceae bacterium]
MLKNLLSTAWFVILLSSCVSTSHNSHHYEDAVNTNVAQVDLSADTKPVSLTELPRTEDGGFVLAPGFYEAEFKTYCLQPGTPDPSPQDAYLQAPLSGYRKDIVETVLYNSRSKPGIEQRHVQLLLWSVVSGSDFNRLSPAVRADAMQLLTSKQVFELKGGVMGVVKNVSYNLPGGGTNGHNNIRRLFEMGSASYEAFEKIAVLRETPQIKRADFKNDQWYKQKQNYYVRHFPVSYQKVRIQVYVPDGVLDSTGKVAGEYLVFDPTGSQTIPANSNAQRLGIGGPFLDIVRAVIKINNANNPPKKLPDNKKNNKIPSRV